MRANSDVIAVVQAGFIGVWGEWYFTDDFVQDPSQPWEVTPEDWANRREVLFAILAALPRDRMVQVRTPLIKQKIYDRTSPLTPAEAHSGSNFARTGFHNDCFLGSETDCGTYLDPAGDKEYLEQETKYLATGGETAVVNPPRSECSAALEELARFHWSILNIDYHPDVLASWESGGCLDEIRRQLGYRFTLVEGTYASEVRPGETFAIDIKLRNDGWAAPFNRRHVELWLRHETTGRLFYAPLDDVDPRFWLPAANQTYSLSYTICTRKHMPRGDYELLLRLPDPRPSLRRRPEYAIRLVNEGVWEDDTGFNKLGHTITVTGPSANRACHSIPRLRIPFRVFLPNMSSNSP